MNHYLSSREMSLLDEQKTLVYKKSSTDKKTSIDKHSTSDTETTKVKANPQLKPKPQDDINLLEQKEHSAKKVLKFLGILLTTILIPVILSAYEDTTDKWIQNLFKNNETKPVAASSEQVNLKSDEATLIKLNQLAYNGRIINCELPLGTSEQTLRYKWGEPDYVSKLGLINYWNYKERHIVIGVYNNRMIDIRSMDPELQKLTLDQIKKTGKPDKEYAHMNLDQHFLVYNMGKYKLRMVFPKPTEQGPSPQLINISLVDINYDN